MGGALSDSQKYLIRLDRPFKSSDCGSGTQEVDLTEIQQEINGPQSPTPEYESQAEETKQVDDIQRSILQDSKKKKKNRKKPKKPDMSLSQRSQDSIKLLLAEFGASDEASGDMDKEIAATMVTVNKDLLL